jgi:hypothetical protein
MLLNILIYNKRSFVVFHSFNPAGIALTAFSSCFTKASLIMKTIERIKTFYSTFSLLHNHVISFHIILSIKILRCHTLISVFLDDIFSFIKSYKPSVNFHLNRRIFIELHKIYVCYYIYSWFDESIESMKHLK